MINITDANIERLEDLNEMEEPSNEDLLGMQDEFVSLDSWDSYKCRSCKTISNMFTCKSQGGSIICPRCGHMD